MSGISYGHTDLSHCLGMNHYVNFLGQSMDDGFIFKKINKNKNIKERKRSWGPLPANQHSLSSPISLKLCVFLTILRPKREELNPSQYDISDTSLLEKNGFSLRLEYIFEPLSFNYDHCALSLAALCCGRLTKIFMRAVFSQRGTMQ